MALSATSRRGSRSAVKWYPHVHKLMPASSRVASIEILGSLFGLNVERPGRRGTAGARGNPAGVDRLRSLTRPQALASDAHHHCLHTRRVAGADRRSPGRFVASGCG